MKKIQVLDCTLRDGGYCNNWRFGKDNIVKIIDKLCDAGIDIVECGFLTNKDCGNPDVSRFESIEAVSGYIKDKKNSKIVLMANYGEFDFDKLPENAQNYIKALEKLIGCKISIVSVGPDRAQTIVLSNPFEKK